MPVDATWSAKYNKAAIEAIRLLGEADSDAAGVLFGNECDAPNTAYSTQLDPTNAAQRLVNNK